MSYNTQINQHYLHYQPQQRSNGYSQSNSNHINHLNHINHHNHQSHIHSQINDQVYFPDHIQPQRFIYNNMNNVDTSINQRQLYQQGTQQINYPLVENNNEVYNILAGIPEVLTNNDNNNNNSNNQYDINSNQAVGYNHEEIKDVESLTLENILDDDPLLSFTTTLDRQESNDTILQSSSPIIPQNDKIVDSKIFEQNNQSLDNLNQSPKQSIFYNIPKQSNSALELTTPMTTRTTTNNNNNNNNHHIFLHEFINNDFPEKKYKNVFDSSITNVNKINNDINSIVQTPLKKNKSFTISKQRQQPPASASSAPVPPQTPIRPQVGKSNSTTKLNKVKKSTSSNSSTISTPLSSTISNTMKKSKSFLNTSSNALSKNPESFYQTLDFSKDSINWTNDVSGSFKSSFKNGKSQMKVNLIKNYEFVLEKGIKNHSISTNDYKTTPSRRQSTSNTPTPTSTKFPKFVKPPSIDIYSPTYSSSSPTNSDFSSSQSPKTNFQLQGVGISPIIPSSSTFKHSPPSSNSTTNFIQQRNIVNSNNQNNNSLNSVPQSSDTKDEKSNFIEFKIINQTPKSLG
ncbi:hypothetical protein WICMUC_004222 [Wickerhamomyces mucosus]|uniref:Uncharacterized protein n=1 Tax=Wickerhamomyces mucosus TaxID=1378264 RepID=A0A9P8PI21_9ASCO|nr:hypothetical protein WICMUC_004222 [Wickerhamomyces mucosus]